MRDRIIQTAMEKINQNGWRKFTIDDIASELGISKKTVYKYFRTKNEIISSVVDTLIEMEKAGALKIVESEGTWRDKLQAIFASFSPEKSLKASEELRRFFPDEWAKIEAIRKLRGRQILDLFQRAREDGEVRSDISYEIIELTCASVAEALYNYRNLERLNLTYKQALEDFRKLLFEGILTKNIESKKKDRTY